ncbi:MAG: cation:proton antiporter [Jatrophihabitantaceae bacterium]
MADSYSYGRLLLLIGVVGIVAVLSNRITARLRVPAPALMLAAAAIAVQLVPSLHAPTELSVDHLVTVALILILFDGGMHIGWSRFRQAAGSIAIVGVAGTFLTTAGAALFLHLAVGLDWYPALLVATAVAPTDPAVVFAVLGQRQIGGNSGTILEGESGANDPVGIALMASLLAAGGLSGSAFGQVSGEFVLQLGVGGLVGLVGGAGLRWFVQRVQLPSEGLYPLRTLACALGLFGIATLAHGSGFLAVFVAGISIGDARAPYKREIVLFHSAASSLGEIVAFVVLGLTVRLSDLSRADVWIPGLLLALVLTLVVRPLVVGGCLLGSGLNRGERGFIVFSGLKGAVPILLGSFLLGAHLASAERLYGIVVIVVVFSVVVQGSLLPTAARLLRVPMRTVEPEPWALGVRLRDEPAGVHRLTVRAGSSADGRSIGDLDELPDDAWVSFVVRAGQLVAVSGQTVLQAGDYVLVLADPTAATELTALFDSSS